MLIRNWTKVFAGDVGAPYIWPSSSPSGTKDKWTVKWENGITAPGSSGSPLFNANNGLILGPLCCGGSFCDKPDNPDWYGSLTKVYEDLVKPYLTNGQEMFSLGKSVPEEDTVGPGEVIPIVNVTDGTCTEAGGVVEWVGDGYCDYTNSSDTSANNNIPECGYDGGDCCKETCTPGQYVCGYNRFECEDPFYQDSATAITATAVLFALPFCIISLL